MYQNIYIDKKTSTTYLWDDNQGFLSFPYKKYAYRKKSSGIYRSMFGDALEKTFHFNPHDPELFESDVQAETAVLRDLYEDSDEPSTGHRVLVYDIEIDDKGGFPDIKQADRVVTAISLYDNTAKQYYALIVDKNGEIENAVNDNIDIRAYQTETELLRAFLTIWEEIQPTIITGWNIDRFDTPYIYNRLKNVLGFKHANRLSPIQTCYFNTYSEKMVIAGVSCLDYILLYKKFIGKNQPSYTLDAIGQTEVGIGKIEYVGSLNKLYKDDIKKYIEYNINDVLIVVELDNKFKYIELAREICHVGHVPYEWFHMSSRYLEGAILMDLRRTNLIAPNKSMDGAEALEQKSRNNSEGFEGAYVKHPVPGRYDWIYDLDLASMYPNIIITLNISPETKVGKVDSISLTASGIKYRTAKLKKEFIESDQHKQKKSDQETEAEYIETRIHDFDSDCFAQNYIDEVNISGEDCALDKFKTILTNGNMSISSNGVLYTQEKQGVIPKLLANWFEQRKQMRALSQKYHEEGNKELEEYYDRKQYSWKIMLNSMYGTLGLSVFRFYDIDNAAAVTATGVSIIQTSGKLGNQYYNNITHENKDYILYIDTDSIFLSAVPIVQALNPEADVTSSETNELMVESILKIASDVQGYINTAYNTMAKRMFNVDKHTLSIKQEIISTTGFWLAKKRYAQWRINENGKNITSDSKKLEIKGIDVVRTSFPKKFRSFLSEILIMILAKKSKEELDKKIVEFNYILKKATPIELAKNTSVRFSSRDETKNYDPSNRHPFTFVLGTPAQAKAALFYNDLLKKFKLHKKIEPIATGNKIKWVYLRENPYQAGGLAFKADGTDPKEIMDIVDMYIDRKGLFEHELKGKLEDFYKVFNWTIPSPDSVRSSMFF